jgi:hypothetical protein
MSEKSLEPARHEDSDIGEWFIWIGAAGLIATVVFFGLVAYLLYPRSMSDWKLHRPLPLYPLPRQQTDPRADMQKFYAEEIQRLNSAGWVDKAKGAVHIPIEEAMRIIAREKIPGWPAPPEKPPALEAQIAPALPKEKPHEAAPPAAAAPAATAAAGAPAALRVCGPGETGNCLRAEAGKPAPKARRAARKHRPRRAPRRHLRG